MPLISTFLLVDISEANRATTNALALRNASLSTLHDHLVLSLLQLLVLILMDVSQPNRQRNGRQTNGCIRTTSGNIPRLVRLRVHVAAVDRSSICHAVRESDGTGALDEGPREGVRNPRDDDLVGAHGSHGHEEHSEVACADYCGAGDDGVSGNGEEDEDADVDGPIACLAGRPGYGDGDQESGKPDCGEIDR